VTLGNPTKRLDDGTGMDLEILKVLFEEIETRVRVSMPSILVWSVEPFDGKAPSWGDAGKAHTFHPPYGPCRRVPTIGDHPHTCSDL
jgi:hypothetical protein